MRRPDPTEYQFIFRSPPPCTFVLSLPPPSRPLLSCGNLLTESASANSESLNFFSSRLFSVKHLFFLKSRAIFFSLSLPRLLDRTDTASEPRGQFWRGGERERDAESEREQGRSVGHYLLLTIFMCLSIAEISTRCDDID